jgi:hypothetical protein
MKVNIFHVERKSHAVIIIIGATTLRLMTFSIKDLFVTLSKTFLCIECSYAEGRVLFIVMLSVVAPDNSKSKKVTLNFV